MAIFSDKVTTAFELPGQRVVLNLGVVRGIVVRSRSLVGSLGAALLNSIAATVAAGYVAGHGSLAATVHGDTVAFTVLVALFAAGAVATGVRRDRIQSAPNL